MKELEVLLNQRWVLKSENKELYYQLRDAIGDKIGRASCRERV